MSLSDESDVDVRALVGRLTCSIAWPFDHQTNDATLLGHTSSLRQNPLSCHVAARVTSRKLNMNWLSTLFSCAAASEAVVWNQDALIIDVRSPSEFASGHVDGALNVPLDRFAQAYTSAAPNKSRQIILYCQSGARSGQAMRILQQQGYENVVNGGSTGAVAANAERLIVRR